MTDKLKEAFPFLETGDCGQRTGMTLRDYFAGQLLASVFSSQMRIARQPTAIAEACYRIADAMLEARK